jgi:hypothetical protein
MTSDTTVKNNTPPEHDLAITALVLLALALEALVIALRPLLAHALALVLTVARWRPAKTAQGQAPKPSAQPIKATQRTRRKRRPAPIAA